MFQFTCYSAFLDYFLKNTIWNNFSHPFSKQKYCIYFLLCFAAQKTEHSCLWNSTKRNNLPVFSLFSFNWKFVSISLTKKIIFFCIQLKQNANEWILAASVNIIFFYIKFFLAKVIIFLRFIKIRRTTLQQKVSYLLKLKEQIKNNFEIKQLTLY